MGRSEKTTTTLEVEGIYGDTGTALIRAIERLESLEEQKSELADMSGASRVPAARLAQDHHAYDQHYPLVLPWPTPWCAGWEEGLVWERLVHNWSELREAARRPQADTIAARLEPVLLRLTLHPRMGDAFDFDAEEELLMLCQPYIDRLAQVFGIARERIDLSCVWGVARISPYVIVEVAS